MARPPRPTLRDRIAKISPSSLGAPSSASTVGCASGACDANVAHVQAAQASKIASLLGAGHPAAPESKSGDGTVGALPRPTLPRPVRTEQYADRFGTRIDLNLTEQTPHIGLSPKARCLKAGGVWDPSAGPRDPRGADYSGACRVNLALTNPGGGGLSRVGEPNDIDGTVGALPRPTLPRPVRTEQYADRFGTRIDLNLTEQTPHIGLSPKARCLKAGGVWDPSAGPRDPRGADYSGACRVNMALTNPGGGGLSRVGEPNGRDGTVETVGRAPTVGISSAGYGGDIGDDCSSDSDCNSSNCLFGYCAPGISTFSPGNLICGLNQHVEADGYGGEVCVCDVGTTWIGGECIQAPDVAMIACGQSGGTWTDAKGCQCPAGSQVDPRNGGCISIETTCFGPDGNPLADNTQCFVGQQPGLCMAGECRTACIDDLGNQGFFDANGICIGTACGLGQGRGEITQRCASCADYGFMPDGIHCRTCPVGMHYVQATDTCECDAPTVFNADWECVDPVTKKVVTPPAPPAPPACGPNEILAGNKCLPKPAGVKCDPRTQIEAVDAAGLPYCKPKTPDDKPGPEGEKKSSNTLLYGLLAVAAAGGLALAITAKKRRKK